ncbi:MAG: peptidoglycan bridge formation glycyltransferase FemA/FemB family protein [Actinobacteria bacterium]|nr:peptidoglycan bridge formation glycyltransferase FemA/FemB family protein [Actinomycetota bacterium]
MPLAADFEIIRDRDEWDAFVHPSGSLLQTYAWGEFKARVGWRPERVGLKRDGSLIAGAQVLYRPTPVGSVAYVPKGPVLKSDEPGLLDSFIQSLHKLMRRRGAMFVKIEPNIHIGPALTALRFRSSAPVQARSTVIVDLSPDLIEISARQKQKTRYNIGLATRRGVEVRQAGIEGLESFSHLMEITGERDKFHIRSLSYFRTLMDTLGEKVSLFLAYHDDEPLAGILDSAFGDEAIYLYGASSNAHRNLMPTYLLQWEAMKWAKARGCKRYDLWGVPEVLEGVATQDGEEGETRQASSNASLEGAWGLLRFKQGFGGDLVKCPGAFDYAYSPALYWLWIKVIPRLMAARGRMGD